MAQRYAIRQIDETYAVVHVETGKPVELNGVLLIGREIQDAHTLAEALELIADAKDARVQETVN